MIALKDAARLRVVGKLTGRKLAVMYHMAMYLDRSRMDVPKDWIII